MKTRLIALLALALPLTAFAETVEEVMLPQQVFTPVGFDDNDHVEVVLHGYFPNTCYRAGPATARLVDGKVVVKNLAYRDTAGPCLKMIVPWTTTASIGVLSSGSYPVYAESRTGKQVLFDQLPIKAATHRSIDDHLYAYVNGIMVKTDSEQGLPPSVTISGSFSINCMYLEDVKIVRNKDNVVNVLPIAAFDRTKPCGHVFVPIPFEKTVQLTEPLEAKPTLFHVRSMNGQSLNQVLE